jgi:hypothetical protein
MVLTTRIGLVHRVKYGVAGRHRLKHLQRERLRDDRRVSDPGALTRAQHGERPGRRATAFVRRSVARSRAPHRCRRTSSPAPSTDLRPSTSVQKYRNRTRSAVTRCSTLADGTWRIAVSGRDAQRRIAAPSPRSRAGAAARSAPTGPRSRRRRGQALRRNDMLAPIGLRMGPRSSRRAAVVTRPPKGLLAQRGMTGPPAPTTSSRSSASTSASSQPG